MTAARTRAKRSLLETSPKRLNAMVWTIAENANDECDHLAPFGIEAFGDLELFIHTGAKRADGLVEPSVLVRGVVSTF